MVTAQRCDLLDFPPLNVPLSRLTSILLRSFVRPSVCFASRILKQQANSGKESNNSGGHNNSGSSNSGNHSSSYSSSNHNGGGNSSNNNNNNGGGGGSSELSKKEEFRKYLEKTGVLDTLTKVLVGLYEEPERPVNAVEYIKRYMGAPKNVDVEGLKRENEQLRRRLAALTVNADKFGGEPANNTNNPTGSNNNNNNNNAPSST